MLAYAFLDLCVLVSLWPLMLLPVTVWTKRIAKPKGTEGIFMVLGQETGGSISCWRLEVLKYSIPGPESRITQISFLR